MHFSDLSSSKAHASPFLISLDPAISSYLSASFDHEDCVFDYDTTEEIQGAITFLKKGLVALIMCCQSTSSMVAIIWNSG